MASYLIKFGGSSVGTPERISNVLAIIANLALYPPGSIQAVVVSAFQGVTDQLIEMARSAHTKGGSYRDSLAELEARHLQTVEALVPAKYRSATLASVKVLLHELADVLTGISLVRECTHRTMDLVMSFGERLSATIVTEAARSAGMSCDFLDTRSLIITNEEHGRSTVKREDSHARIRTHFSTSTTLQIATGFIASSTDGVTTTLGRGGSDYTAALLGSALSVDEIHIWTDVDGMLTADPRKVSKAITIPEVSVDEAMELCHFGAKVIYPPTIQPAVESSIPLVIKNTFNPLGSGTRISKTIQASTDQNQVTGVTSIPDIAFIRVQGSGMVGVAGVAARLFRALASKKINIILITQASSEHTICCAIEPSSINAARSAVTEEFSLEIANGLLSPLVIEEQLSIVSVVGERMRSSPGISGRVFAALGSNGINVVAIAQGSSELNISAVVQKGDEVKALNALHDEFFIGASKTIHIWLLGTGLIGSTLLRQMEQQREILRTTHGIELNLQGVANSRVMRLAPSDVHSSLPFKTLDDNAIPYSEGLFFSHIKASARPNEVFVDCTSGTVGSSHYPELLEVSVPVVTPNKKGLSGTFETYRISKEIARRKRVPFLHETSVGAGLPVLSTLHDLIRSGDTLFKIEAVLSGTLSFIFNQLAGGVKFSTAVRTAKELGLTEPDPRDDLSGMDVARKVLILAREGGLAIELEDIKATPLLPPHCSDLSAQEFMDRLEELDPLFEDIVTSARGKALRPFFSAEVNYQTQECCLGLVLLPLAHPFAALSGSDNIISFTTRRYEKQSLVVKGPGAGAEVTAAGVFADIIRIAH